MHNLSGNIETIGITELLRVPMTTRKSGELVLVGAEEEARCYYESGRLVQIVMAGETGGEALGEVIGWNTGEFEFREGDLPAGLVRDDSVNQQLVEAIKVWYLNRSRATRRPAVNESLHAQQVQVPGLKLVADMNSRAVGASTGGGPPAGALAGPSSTGVGVDHRQATLSAQGRVKANSGGFSDQEAALGAIVRKLAVACGKELALGTPLSARLGGSDGRTLELDFSGEGILARATGPTRTDGRR